MLADDASVNRKQNNKNIKKWKLVISRQNI